MRLMLATVVAAAAMTGAAAENSSPSGTPAGSPDSSSGQTYMPSHQKHMEQQPQGPTGPLDTTTGGAPAESPQGQSPPGMQAAPEGSSKVIIDDKK